MFSTVTVEFQRHEPGSSETDESLLRHIAQGDRRAFQSFYRRNAGRVLAVLRKLCQDPVVAEDLLQEVFLSVWRRAATYRRERGDAMGWLFAITRNKVVDLRRRRTPTSDASDDELSNWPEPARQSEELKLGIAQALAGLSPEQREALQLTYFSGYTYEETAQHLSIPLGTLKSRIRAGLSRLRVTLEGA